jgi:hypothetical protein
MFNHGGQERRQLYRDWLLDATPEVQTADQLASEKRLQLSQAEGTICKKHKAGGVTTVGKKRTVRTQCSIQEDRDEDDIRCHRYSSAKFILFQHLRHP